MNYLRRAWYVAGYADELASEQLLARTLLDEPLVFFRRPDGSIAALLDRCPHRFAPLSAGKICDNGASVQCGYHGLRFDGSGACVHSPHADGAIPKAAVVKAYSVLERHGLLWFWADDASEADESLIPDYSKLNGAAEDATVRGYLPTGCDYRLLVDNILDLTHVDYLHAGTLGSGAMTRAKAQVTDLGERGVRIAWLSSGDKAPAVFDNSLRQQGQPTDQWTEVTWTAPANMMLQVGATLAGESRQLGVDSLALHLATPESAGRTHYWYWSTRTFGIDPHANAAIKALLEFAFSQQDKPMLEAQQGRMGGAEFWSLKPVLLPGDAGAVRVRRRLDALIGAEGAER
ncbi:aromatic ring-hydroxylating dioxygenase subunit alpha [Ramlibacter sp. WS9]|uniref:aromatic ring-hydroxylating dioxygenase subunit alpha n=1 Tax=Ramlibacter sp. WS9 TaxID=1882741 RepID=UPI0011447748|nr:aromatic ring-hydroxylating dioxygenase subunit alpha [Ramlibacter sp. WS9]ROZ75110.1 aromatic ring-hydroxylating dioxygenase subunit alpha [Ramlibacter sp. WS9]